MTYQFNEFELDPDRRELRRGGQHVPVEPKVFDLLQCLITNRDRVVSKEELISAIWGGRTISESTLTTCVNAARAAIGDSGQHQTLLKTFPRKGLRFVADTQEVKGKALPVLHRGREFNSRSMPLPDKPAIVVLPMSNLSSETDQEFFSAGVTDDIITRLSRYPDLYVIAGNKNFQWRGQPIDVREIGRDLGVRYVLEGSIRHSGNRVRISAQLSDAANGIQRWADRYDHSLDDVFAVQDEVTSTIVSLTTAHIRRAELDRLSRKPTEIWEAFDVYLRAADMLVTFDHTWRLEDLQLAHHLLEQAIALDAAPATFHALLAQAYHSLFTQHFSTTQYDPKIADLAFRASGTAVRLDPNLALAHAKHALSLVFRREHDAAIFELDKALHLNANLSDCCLVAICAYCGEFSRGLELSRGILRTDPFYSPVVAMWTGVCRHLLKQYEQAEPYLLESVSRAPDFKAGHLWLAMNHARLNKMDLATKEVSEALRIDPTFSVGEKAEKILSFFKRKADMEFIMESMRLAGLPD